MNASSQALVEKLAEVAVKQFLLLGNISADDIRLNANDILDGVPSTVVSAVLTAALRKAGGKPTTKTQKSLIEVSRRRRLLIWTRSE